MFLVMGCNSGSDKDTANTDPITQQVDTAKAADTSQGLDFDQDSTSTKPAASNAQDDTFQFHKDLSYKNSSFIVTAKGKGSLQQLRIQPSGNLANLPPIVLQVDPVVGAEVEDFNSDGYPELLVFTQSAGSGSYGKMLAYSVNNGKSISQVTFPATNENPRIGKGYMGHDHFEVINKQLVQTFPIYDKEDVNSKRIGKNRVVTYKLKDGEASRIFEVDKVKEVAQQ